MVSTERHSAYRRRQGMAERTPGIQQPIFWGHVTKGAPDECWVWTGAKCRRGYGKYASTGAHRVAFQLEVGPIPEGLELDHLCNNPPCVNPAHLEPVTRAENQRRRALRTTRCARGHLFSPDNTYIYPSGRNRSCRTCRRSAAAKYNAAHVLLGRAWQDRTHCPAGHPYDEINTRRNAAGHRSCRACDRERSRIRRAQSKENTL